MENMKIKKIGVLIEKQKNDKNITNEMIAGLLNKTPQAVSKNLNKINNGQNCGIRIILELLEAVGLEEIVI